MGMHVEWLGAKSVSVGIIDAGAMWDGEIVGPDADEDVIVEGNVGLVIGEDTVTIIEGTPAELRKILTDALAALAAHENEQRPEIPTGHDPACPDCGSHRLALYETEGVIRWVKSLDADGILRVDGESEGVEDGGGSEVAELYCRHCLTVFRLPENIDYI